MIKNILKIVLENNKTLYVCENTQEDMFEFLPSKENATIYEGPKALFAEKRLDAYLKENDAKAIIGHQRVK